MFLFQNHLTILLIVKLHLSHEKNPLTFHYIGCLIGILGMVSYNPHCNQGFVSLLTWSPHPNKTTSPLNHWDPSQIGCSLGNLKPCTAFPIVSGRIHRACRACWVMTACQLTSSGFPMDFGYERLFINKTSNQYRNSFFSSYPLCNLYKMRSVDTIASGNYNVFICKRSSCRQKMDGTC